MAAQTARQRTLKLLDTVAGTPPTLAKVAQGYGRVATLAHPMCTCGTFSRGPACFQHAGVRFGTRYAMTAVPADEAAAA